MKEGMSSGPGGISTGATRLGIWSKAGMQDSSRRDSASNFNFHTKSSIMQKHCLALQNVSMLDHEVSVDGREILAAHHLRLLKVVLASQNDSTLNDVISEGDTEVLAYLTDVRTVTCENQDGYKITFKFAANPFFKNKVLERSDTMATLEIGGNIIRHSISKSTTIEWLQR